MLKHMLTDKNFTWNLFMTTKKPDVRKNVIFIRPIIYENRNINLKPDFGEVLIAYYCIK